MIIITKYEVTAMSLELKEGIGELIRKGQSMKDYIFQKRTNKLYDLEDATAADIEASEEGYAVVQEFIKTKTSHSVQCSRPEGKLVLTFSATQVPESLVDGIKPPDGELYKYVNSYDPGSKTVEMIFDMEEVPEAGDFERDIHHKGGTKGVLGWDESLKLELKEDEMAPTPVPYEQDDHTVGPDGKRISRKDKTLDELLNETAGLEVTNAERVMSGNPGDSDRVAIKINGTAYEFTPNEDCPYLVGQLIDKFNKVAAYSHGRALQFLKKYATGAKSELVSEGFIEKASKSVKDSDDFSTDYTMYYDTENDKYVFVFGDKDIYRPEDGDFDWECDSEEEAQKWFDFYKGYVNGEEDMVERLREGNQFKSHHKCTTCGKPISQCSCKVEDEEVVNEALGATATLSISDLKAFFDKSETAKKDYPNFFAWYDAMAKAGKIGMGASAHNFWITEADEDRDAEGEGTEDAFANLVADLQDIKGYSQYVSALKKLNPEQTKLFMQYFGKIDPQKPSVGNKGIPATTLIPTQSEIDWKKSLSYGLKQDCSYFFKPPVELGMPVLVYDGKYIIDGHHRWSQVFMFNPKADVSCVNFTYDQNGPLDVLKDFQAAVLAQTGEVKVGTAGTNIWNVDENTLREFIDSNISDACWESLVKNKVATDRESAINYIVGNAMTLQDKVKPINNAPDRVDMPQTDPDVIKRAAQALTDMSESCLRLREEILRGGK